MPQNLKLENKTLSWEDANGKDGQRTAYFVVYAFPINEEVDFDNPKYIIARTQDKQIKLNIDPTQYRLAVTSINHYKQESIPCCLEN